MTRSLNASTQAELSKAETTLAYLYYGAWTEGELRLTDNGWDLTAGANTYQATAGLLGFSEVEESPSIKVNEVTISLSGLDNSILSFLNTVKMVGIAQALWRVWLDKDTGQIIGDPVLIHSGYSDGDEIAESDGNVIIAIKSRDRLSDFDRVSGRRTNDTEHRLVYPSDRGFEFIATSQEKTVQW